MLKKIFILLLLIGGVAWFYTNRIRPRRPDWQTVVPGVEFKKIQIKDSDFLNDSAEVNVLRLDPKRFHVVMGSAKTAEQWREFTQSVAAVNGGFFDENNHSLGLRQANGKELSALRHANWGVFFIRNGKARILHTRDFQNIDKQSITEAVQCGPRLVVDGHPTDLKDQWARRTGIGIDAQGKVLIAVCDSEVPLRDWAKFWAATDGLHCRQALNLDGGGSSQLSLKSGNNAIKIDGLWPVPDAVVIR
jgi:uncharacterized protein YigE (DUF2233 family)